MLSTVIWDELKVVHPIRVTTLQPSQSRINMLSVTNEQVVSSIDTPDAFNDAMGTQAQMASWSDQDGFFFTRDRTF